MQGQQLIQALQNINPRATTARTQIAGSAYNTTFGVINTAGNQPFAPNALEASNEAILRELGILRDVTQKERLRTALINPDEYLVTKNNDEIRIGNLAADTFRQAASESIRAGYTIEDSNKKGLKAAKEQYARLLKEHNQRYPSDITKKIAKSL